MARTRGSRNADFAVTRLDLARRVARAALGTRGPDLSLREMAAEAGTSVANLRHYFRDRQGALTAAMEAAHVDGAPHVAAAAMPILGDVRASLERLLGGLGRAWHLHGVGRVHAAGLSAGLGAKSLGPAYVNNLLEPTLQCAESLLRGHVEHGDIPPCDVRHAALGLMAPVVLALLHQDSLSGAGCRPLDTGAFIKDHLDAFLAAHPPRVTAGAKPTS
jgi:AcrR family transcriptional regulator